MRRRRAVTLTETIIAIFVLTLALGFIGGVLQLGLRHQARTERRLAAAHLAKKRLAEVRAWARTKTTGTLRRFDESESAWNAEIRRPDPDFPDYVLDGFARSTVLLSPCTAVEKNYAPARRRAMPNSAKTVKVSVADPGDPGWSVDLLTLVADPAREMATVNGTVSITNTSVAQPLVGAGGNLLSPNPGSFIDMTAHAKLLDGREAQDLFYDWYVVNLGGSGTLFPARDGRTCRFVNGLDAGVVRVATLGACAVAVHGNYAGQGAPPQVWVLGTGNPYIGVTNDGYPAIQLGPNP